jgi:MAGE family
VDGWRVIFAVVEFDEKKIHSSQVLLLHTVPLPVVESFTSPNLSTTMPKATKRKNRSRTQDDDEEEDDDDRKPLCFSQVKCEPSQDIAPVKPSEQRNLDNLKPEDREKVLLDLSRLLLFKALAGEPIDRVKVAKEAGVGQGKISTAAFAEAAERLRNVFGFELKRLPQWQEKQKSVPKRFHDRHFIMNSGLEDTPGDHNKKIFGTHSDTAVEKGLLMVILGLTYCKGNKLADGSRWISEVDLYKLLNKIDENIPAEPPTAAVKKAGGRLHALTQDSTDVGVMCTPDVDQLLEQYVKQDYLMKERLAEDSKVIAALLTSSSTNNMTMSQNEEQTFVYTMGPRAAVEIGRKQVVIFCADVLDEHPDETMLMEYENDDEEGVDVGMTQQDLEVE